LSKQQPGWAALEIGSYHYPMVTEPEATAALLDQ
jgi:hypothetical protein